MVERLHEDKVKKKEQSVIYKTSTVWSFVYSRLNSVKLCLLPYADDAFTYLYNILTHNSPQMFF